MWYHHYCSLVGTYLVSSLVCFIIDMKFSLGKGYKIKDDISRSDYINLYRKFAPLSLFNICILSIPVVYIMDIYHLSYLPFYPDTDSILKGILICIAELLFIWIDMDILFYSIHRLEHHPSIYKYIHKKHHELVHPIGVGAVYVHPIDFYVGNIIPIVLSAYMVASNVLVYHIWIIISILSTVTMSHSGFKGISDQHDYHHTMSKYNYGIDVFMDRLFGTYHYPSANWYYGNYIDNNIDNNIDNHVDEIK